MTTNLPIVDTGWWSLQLFKSKLIGTPIYHEILTSTNGIVKVIFFEGQAFNRNDVANFIYSRSWRAQSYGLNLSQHEMDHISPTQQEIINQLVAIGVIVPEYETHPYHKLKNPALLGYDKGPKFDIFTTAFEEVLYEKELIVELDVIAKDNKNEQV